jgi:MFS superfamily sulfate permease-like transporter
MGRITALFLSIITGGLTTYYGVAAFFNSGSQLASDLETHLLTRHAYFVVFLVLVTVIYIVMSWVPHLIAKHRFSFSPSNGSAE